MGMLSSKQAHKVYQYPYQSSYLRNQKPLELSSHNMQNIPNNIDSVMLGNRGPGGMGMGMGMVRLDGSLNPIWALEICNEGGETYPDPTDSKCLA